MSGGFSMLYNKLKKIFTLNKTGNVDIRTRRAVLKGALSLAAIAVVSTHTGSLTLLNQNDIELLVSMIEKGVVVNQTFYIDRDIELRDFKDGLVIDKCKFIFTGDHTIYFDKNIKGLQITNSIFNGNFAVKNKPYIYIS